MFGQNARYKQGFVDAPYLVVNSVFATIQGEGPYAGYPAIFVRLSHCNLACTFCDTEFETGTKMLTHELMNKVKEVAEQSGIKHKVLVITGGEPLLQNLREFVQHYYLNFNHQDHFIQIETAGTVWHDNLEAFIWDGKVRLVCSPKTPNVHTSIKTFCVDWKYIVKEGWISEDDGLPEQPTQPGLTKRTKLARPFRPDAKIYVQPVDEQNEEQNFKNMQFAAQIAMKHGYILSLQTHKILDLP